MFGAMTLAYKNPESVHSVTARVIKFIFLPLPGRSQAPEPKLHLKAIVPIMKYVLVSGGMPIVNVAEELCLTVRQGVISGIGKGVIGMIFTVREQETQQ